MATKKLISNQVYTSIQQPSTSIIESTGTIIYANSYSGREVVAMPEEYATALNRDYGEIGTNVLAQLKKKVQQFPDGPWYIDSLDGILYIHNCKFNEPSRATFEYQAGNGEVLSVSFETQYVKKSPKARASSGIDMQKGLTNQMMTLTPSPLIQKNIAQDYIPEGAVGTVIYGERAAADYAAGRLDYSQIKVLDQRAKNMGRKGAYSEKDWKSIQATRKKEIETKRYNKQTETDRRYQIYMASGNDEASRETAAINKAVDETLATQNLQYDVYKFFSIMYGNPSWAQQEINQLDQMARNGTLESYIRSNYSNDIYKFQRADDQAAKVTAYHVYNYTGSGGGISLESVDKNPYAKAIDRGLSYDSKGKPYIKTFGRAQVDTSISGYRLLHAYYSRKYNLDKGLSDRVLAAVNSTKLITEKKLIAKLQVIGRPSLASSQIITILNVGKRWSGTWRIKQCIHQIESGSGYTTQLALVKHAGIEGHNTGTKKAGHTVSKSSDGTGTSKENESMTLSKKEIIYAATHTQAEVEDMLIKKMSNKGESVAITSKQTNEGTDIGTSNDTQLINKPTDEERKKYGRKAATIAEEARKSSQNLLKSLNKIKSK
jgi:hypothetical protein